MVYYQKPYGLFFYESPEIYFKNRFMFAIIVLFKKDAKEISQAG